MLKQLHCIALRTVKYNERHNILSVYTLEAGRVSLLMPAGRGREAARRRAITMPLSVFTCVADMRSDRDIYNVRDTQLSFSQHSIHANPIKNAIAIFLAEVLSATLKECHEDSLLFNFMTDAIARLEQLRQGMANFHIAFLYLFGRHLGIEPDSSTYSPGYTFDMHDGTFRASAPLHNHYLSGEDAATVARLSRISWDNAHAYRFTRTERQRALQIMLDYYTIHYVSISSLHSLEVLKVLFD